MQQLATNIGLQAQYQQAAQAVLAKGNAASLSAAISNPVLTGPQLKGVLLQPGPYLSNTILQQATTRPQPMPNADLGAVLSTNTPLDPEVLETLNKTNPTLAQSPSFIAAQKLKAISEKHKKEAEQEAALAARIIDVRALVQHYFIAEKYDSALALLALNNLSFDRAALFNGFYKNPTDAQSAVWLSGYNSTYGSLQTKLLNDARGLPYTLKAADTTAIIAQANSNISVQGVLAQNMHYVWHKKRHLEYLPDTTQFTLNTQRQAAQSFSSNPEALAQSPQILLSPNPAANQVSISVPLLLTEPNLSLSIYNAQGYKMAYYPRIRYTTIVSTKDYPSGTYLVVLHNKEQLLARTTLIIQH
jgi:hypothetical protein